LESKHYKKEYISWSIALLDKSDIRNWEEEIDNLESKQLDCKCIIVLLLKPVIPFLDEPSDHIAVDGAHDVKHNTVKYSCDISEVLLNWVNNCSTVDFFDIISSFIFEPPSD